MILDRYGISIKKGDRVICIDSLGTSNDLTEKRFYIVERTDHINSIDVIHVKANSGYIKWYSSNRFKRDLAEYRSEVVNNILE